MFFIEKVVQELKEILDDEFRSQSNIEDIDADNVLFEQLDIFIEDMVEGDKYKILMEYGLNRAYKDYQDEYGNETVNGNILECLVYYIIRNSLGDANEYLQDFKNNRLGENED